MKARPIACAALTLAVAACDGPYPPACAGFPDACTKARDLATLVAVQLGDEAVSTGNAIIGQGGALQDEGKMEVSFRAKVTSRENPQFDNVTVRTDAPAASRFGVDARPTTSFAADVALGITRGTRVGDTRVAALDLLGGLTLTPHLDGGTVVHDELSAHDRQEECLGIMPGVIALPAASGSTGIAATPR
jgi:hypothetical protein